MIAGLRFSVLSVAAGLLHAVAALLVSASVFAACPDGDLLMHRAPVSSRGVANPGRLTDGLLAYEGDVPPSLAASGMKGVRPYVEWDLGEVETIAGAAVQADNNDVYRLSGSVDGRAYTPLWTLDLVHEPGLRERTRRDLQGTARYVRLEALSGDRTYAASEVRVYCRVPDTWPPTHVVRSHPVDDPLGTKLAQTESLKIVLGFCALPLLFFFLPRLRARARRVVFSALIALSALSWVHFGYFQGKSAIHYWDMFHYFVGTKYFPELGYFDLYRCGARAEREAGHGAEADSTPVRDLDDNRLYPGDWTRTKEGRCRAHFMPARWQSFRDDLKTFRGIFVGHTLSEAFGDHGFNATPLNVAWLRLFTHRLSPTGGHLLLLAQMDSVALAGTIAVLYWGFGAVPAVAACLVLAIGFPWNYHWVGGCLGRDTWLFCAAAGLSLLARKRLFWGAVLLTLSGLFRLFPFIFVGGAGLWAFVNAIRARRFTPSGRRFLAGVAITMVVGTATAGAAVGFGAYRNFVHVITRHADTPLANQMGLSTVLGFRVGETSQAKADGRFTDPMEPWSLGELHHRVEERPLWVFAMVLSLGVIVCSAWQGASAVVCAALSGLLLFCALPMTSYDYSWLVLLIPLARLRPSVLPRLVAFALFTQVCFVFGGDTIEQQHVIYSIACGLLLLSVMPWRELVERRSLAEPEAPS